MKSVFVSQAIGMPLMIIFELGINEEESLLLGIIYPL
jgi:hypothetical protein